MRKFKIVFHVEDHLGTVMVPKSQIEIGDVSFFELAGPDLTEAIMLTVEQGVTSANDCLEYRSAQQVRERFEAAGISISRFTEIKLRQWAKAAVDGTAPGVDEPAAPSKERPLSSSAMTVVDAYPSHAHASMRTAAKFARGTLVDDGSRLYRHVANGDGYLYRVDTATGRSIISSLRTTIQPSDLIALD